MDKEFEILIDSREKFGLKSTVKKQWKLPYIEYPLECGDIALRSVPLGKPCTWMAGAERKKMNDLIQSIMTKRIFDQVKRMKAKYVIGYLCVVGDLDDVLKMLREDVGLRVSEDQIYGTLASISVRNKFHLMWFPNDKTLFTVMYKVFEKLSEGKYDEPMRMAPKLSKYNAVSTLSDHVPGVNKKIAQRLLDRFGSIKGIATARKEQLTIIDGVGTSTADLLHNLLCVKKE